MADSNISVTVTSHKKEILSEFERKVVLALSQLGMLAEGYAKKDCPVDTGRLRNSITYDVKSDAVYIGTNVVYAAKQEYGDRFHHTTGKAHFLRDAAATHNDEYKKKVKEIMES